MSAIIHSLLDTDLYKFTMLQVVLHKFPQTDSVYQFRCRNLDDTAYPLVDILDDLNEQLDYLCQLNFKADELEYLRKRVIERSGRNCKQERRTGTSKHFFEINCFFRLSDQQRII